MTQLIRLESSLTTKYMNFFNTIKTVSTFTFFENLLFPSIYLSPEKRNLRRNFYITYYTYIAQSDFVRMMTIHKEEEPELDEIKELLEQDETNNAIKTKYAIAIQEGDESTAQDLLTQYVPTSVDAWNEFQELMIEIRLNGNPQDLTSNQLNTLESFITNNKKEEHVAKAMLWMATGIEYEEDLEFPDEDKSFADNKPKTLPTVELPELNVFPNPASNEVFFTFELPEEMKNTFIKIYSLEGKLVFEDDLTGRKGMYRVDISNLALGSYLSEILVDDIQIINTKFVKQ